MGSRLRDNENVRTHLVRSLRHELLGSPIAVKVDLQKARHGAVNRPPVF